MMEARRDQYLLVNNIALLACAIALDGDLERAVRLYGATDALFEPMGVGPPPGDQPEHASVMALIHSRIDAATFETYWQAGRKLTLEEAIQLAL